jgi:hypothetical protein
LFRGSDIKQIYIETAAELTCFDHAPHRRRQGTALDQWSAMEGSRWRDIQLSQYMDFTFHD